MSKFEMGRTVVTADVSEKMQGDPKFTTFVCVSLGRFSQADWGDLCDGDRQQNEDSLKNGERLMGVYIRPSTNEKIWIITEWDRSVTTVLFPHEY